MVTNVRLIKRCFAVIITMALLITMLPSSAVADSDGAASEEMSVAEYIEQDDGDNDFTEDDDADDSGDEDFSGDDDRETAESSEDEADESDSGEPDGESSIGEANINDDKEDDSADDDVNNKVGTENEDADSGQDSDDSNKNEAGSKDLEEAELEVEQPLMPQVATIPIAPFSSGGDIIYVKSDGNDESDGTTADDAVATLKQAYEKVADGGTIAVLSDLIHTGTTIFSDEKTVTIQSYEDETEIKTDGWLIEASALTLTYGMLELLDGKTILAHIKLNANNQGRVVYISTNATLEIADGAIITGARNLDGNASAGGGVFTSGTLIMSGGEISNNEITTSENYHGGGGVCVSGGTFTMNSGEIINNSVIVSGVNSGGGGGVYVYSGEFIMNGGNIDDNYSYTTDTIATSGGVLIGKYGTFTMNGGTISGNEGGVRVSDNSIFTMNGGEISNHYNGILINDGASFIMNSGVIRDNEYGVEIGGNFTISGGEIKDNHYEGVNFYSIDESCHPEMTISGGSSIINISGNARRNIMIGRDQTIFIEGIPVEGSDIGVELGVEYNDNVFPYTFTTGGNATAWAGTLSSDDDDYTVRLNGTELQLFSREPIYAKSGGNDTNNGTNHNIDAVATLDRTVEIANNTALFHSYMYINGLIGWNASGSGDITSRKMHTIDGSETGGAFNIPANSKLIIDAHMIIHNTTVGGAGIIQLAYASTLTLSGATSVKRLEIDATSVVTLHNFATPTENIVVTAPGFSGGDVLFRCAGTTNAEAVMAKITPPDGFELELDYYGDDILLKTASPAVNAAPTATAVTANSTSAAVVIGTPLTGDYTYNAGTGTGAGADASTYQWYRSDSATWGSASQISGATSKTYTPTGADLGKYLFFEVTPSNGTLSGTPVQSAAVGQVGIVVSLTIVQNETTGIATINSGIEPVTVTTVPVVAATLGDAASVAWTATAGAFTNAVIANPTYAFPTMDKNVTGPIAITATFTKSGDDPIPVITDVSANPNTFGSAGGSSVITVTGTNLANGITVTAFESQDVSVDTAATTGDGTTQTATLNFPANTSTTEDKKYKVKASLYGGTDWDDTYSFPVTVSKASIHTESISTATITISGTYAYTDNPITPTSGNVLVALEGETLTYGTDYTFVATNNTNAGTATLTITGTGNYTGTKTASFTIDPASINGASVTTNGTYTYTGHAITPSTGNVAVVLNGKTLTNLTDYTYTATNNINVGTATLAVSGKGNYVGTATTSFNIGQAAQSALTITGKPSTITYGDKFTLVTSGGSGTGAVTYAVTDGGNYATVNSSTGAVEITGVGSVTITATKAADSNHTAAVTATTSFTSVRRDISSATVTVGGAYTYNGSAQKPNTGDIAITWSGKTLLHTTDYIYAASDNINAGTATLTITGTGNYTGTKTVNFTIAPATGQTIQTEVGAGVPSTDANLFEMFTPTDAALLAAGANVEIKLNVNALTSPSADDASKIQQVLSGMTTGIYLDLQLLRTVTGSIGSDVSNDPIQPPPGTKLTIIINLPANLQNLAPYAIIRVHNGVATSITPIYDQAAQTLTFETDAFSTYAIAYTSTTQSRPQNQSTGGSRSGGSRTYAAIAPSTYQIGLSEAKALAEEAKTKNLDYVRTRASGVTGISKSVLQSLTGLNYQHDTTADGAIQVRMYIDEPAKATKDIFVSGYVSGNSVNTVKTRFDNWYSDKKYAVVSLDQQGDFGMTVQVAAKVDLSGMDTNNLYFYSYDRQANKYVNFQPEYRVDSNGYLHFATKLAGDIIISSGSLKDTELHNPNTGGDGDVYVDNLDADGYYMDNPQTGGDISGIFRQDDRMDILVQQTEQIAPDESVGKTKLSVSSILGTPVTVLPAVPKAVPQDINLLIAVCLSVALVWLIRLSWLFVLKKGTKLFKY